MPKYQIDDADMKVLENSFTYHPPQPDQIPRYENLRSQALLLAIIIKENTPRSPEQTLAIRKLEEAIMWANKSIACGEIPSGD